MLFDEGAEARDRGFDVLLRAAAELRVGLLDQPVGRLLGLAVGDLEQGVGGAALLSDEVGADGLALGGGLLVDRRQRLGELGHEALDDVADEAGLDALHRAVAGFDGHAAHALLVLHLGVDEGQAVFDDDRLLGRIVECVDEGRHVDPRGTRCPRAQGWGALPWSHLTSSI